MLNIFTYAKSSVCSILVGDYGAVVVVVAKVCVLGGPPDRNI